MEISALPVKLLLPFVFFWCHSSIPHALATASILRFPGFPLRLLSSGNRRCVSSSHAAMSLPKSGNGSALIAA
jgi:hypothetical protein